MYILYHLSHYYRAFVKIEFNKINLTVRVQKHIQNIKPNFFHLIFNIVSLMKSKSQGQGYAETFTLSQRSANDDRHLTSVEQVSIKLLALMKHTQ